ncbi:DUF4275 family protein [Sutcliffiella halmapala]|uniref:DUF4275 family protein n=1 Tax=Sutcliffiella halmapala TaxID=79882 RepID=UPI000995D47E|nr:DUF4275 family protein [Sutcliffiella halmapala]
MELVDILKRKNMNVVEMPNEGSSLRKQWEKNFASHITASEKDKIFLYDTDGTSGFLWHIFSYNKRDFFEGEKAEEDFNLQSKKSCYIFYQHSDHAFMIETASTLNHRDLLDEEDIYVVDTEFTWTYVRTHESGWCGPYYSRKK